jgi:2-polyprenyl-3-methyl-5-hydroxy-6-metoxy-1,4-benzoquinol methylase
MIHHEIAVEWDKNVVDRSLELEHGNDASYFEVLVPTIEQHLQNHLPSGNILDVGCGLGFLSKKLVESGNFVTGIDFSERSIDYAKTKFQNDSLRFIFTSLESFSKIEQNVFHAAVCNMFFHNVSDLRRELSNIHSLVKKSGILIFSIPHPCFWFVKKRFPHCSEFSYLAHKDFKLPFKIHNGKVHQSPFTYFHRPLESYFDSIVSAGFEILEVDEPSDVSSIDSTDLLFFVCQRKH